MVLVLLTSLNCYMSTLRPVHYTLPPSDTRMLKIQQYERKSRGFRAVSCFGPHIWSSLHKTLETAQPCQLLKPN